MDEDIFRYEWREPYLSDEPEDQYFSLGRNDQGWWYDSEPNCGMHTVLISGGAERVKAFAEWLLTRHAGMKRYFTAFDLVDEDNLGPDGLSVELSLDRKIEDGPERLMIWHSAYDGGGVFSSCCAELSCENVDRERLEGAARSLLAALAAEHEAADGDRVSR